MLKCTYVLDRKSTKLILKNLILFQNMHYLNFIINNDSIHLSISSIHVTK